MTPHELDPYFDPNASDWEQFDRKRYYDDDEDEDEDDDNNDSIPDLKKEAKGGFMIGIGIADSIAGNNN